MNVTRLVKAAILPAIIEVDKHGTRLVKVTILSAIIEVDRECNKINKGYHTQILLIFNGLVTLKSPSLIKE